MRTPVLAVLSWVFAVAACNKEGGGTSDGSDTIVTTDGPTDPPVTSTTSGTSDEPTSTGTGASETDTTAADPGTSTGTTADASSGDTTTGGPDILSTVEPACAPDDGPALAFKIDLTEAVCGAAWTEEELTIVLFQDAPLAPGTYPLDGAMGFALLRTDEMDEGSFGDIGGLTIDTWDGAVVRGSYDVTFMDQQARAGTFVAVFCPVQLMCG